MAIMMGLAIGAAMGGGIAALRGGKTDDILKGALIGGATGAIGGGIAPLLSGGAGGVAGGVATVAGGDTGAFIAADQVASQTASQAATPAGILNTPTLDQINFNSAGNSSILGPDGSGADNSVNVMRGLRMPGSPSISDVAPTASDGLGIKPPAGFMTQTPKPDGFFDSGVGKFLADNKGTLGLGAAGLLMSNKGNSQSSQPDSDSYIRPYKYNRFNQTYTAQTPVKASDFGATTVANGGIIRMAEGGDPEVATEQQQRENTSNPTLEALAAIQQAQQSYQPPQPTVSQGITQPLIQPQMAQIQQQYAAPQRQSPDAFQYQAPSFVKYANVGGGGIAGAGGGGGEAIDPITKQPVKTVAQIIAAKAKPAGSGVSGTYTGPGVNGDAESYYDRYPVAQVYDYANNKPTRPYNPNDSSPEFNVPSNFPVNASSGLAEIQQMYANRGYTDFIPDATTDYAGNTAKNGGLMPEALRYAMGGGIGDYYASPDDSNHNFGGIGALNQGPQYPMQGIGYAMGGHLGGYSDGGQLLKGPGDGVSDDIPAQIGARQPARLADGEFVVPARIVSELGNGSTDAGAKRLYAMMDRIQKNRGKTVGKGKVAVNSRSDKYLPA